MLGSIMRGINVAKSLYNLGSQASSRLENTFGNGVQDANNAYSFAAMQYANELEQSTADRANRVAQQNATISFERQKELQQMAMDFNAAEAEKARAYDERMSGTAYQRAVEDMKAAGINPILAFSNGGAAFSGGQAASIGASTASQAQTYMASVHDQQIDQSSNRELTKTRMEILGNLFSTYLNNASRVQSTLLGNIGSIAKFLGGAVAGG